MLLQHHTAPGAYVQYAPWHRPHPRCRCRKTTTRLFVRSEVTAAAEAPITPPVAQSILPAPMDAHFEQNSTVFVEEFRIRGNEAGPDQRANIITIANLLQVRKQHSGETGVNFRTAPMVHMVKTMSLDWFMQEIGGNHGVAMWGRSSSGFAAMPGMDHLIFVATRMQIRMVAYPNW